MTPPAQRLVQSRVVSGQAAEARAAVTAFEATRAPAGNPVTWFLRLAQEVVNKADRDRMLGLAAETAFFAVLTLFPTLLVVAAVLGKSPPDLRYWISTGPAPGFLKFEGAMFLNGPIWRIELATPRWATER